MPRGETWGRWPSARTPAVERDDRRGPHDPARRGRDGFPWLPRASRSGRKQKQWETGLTSGSGPHGTGRRWSPAMSPSDCTGGGVGFGARRAPTHPVAGGLTTQSCQARPLLPSQGMWEARFQPGWIWFLRICVHRKRGRTPDESCLSKLHCGSSGSLNYGHCMVQYSTACAAHGGREEKIVLETRLIAVGCS